MFFKSLRKEILAFTLGLTIIAVVITTSLGVLSTRTAGDNAEKATSDTLRQQTKDSLMQIAGSAAQRQDLIFERARDDASSLASYSKNFYENPSVFNNDAYWRFDDHVIKKGDRYLNKESDVTTIFIPNYVTVNAETKKKLETDAALDFIFPSVLKNNQNATAVYIIDKSGVSRYFPNIVLGNIAPPDHSTLDDPVYKQATPKEDPNKKIVWSPLYDDPAGQGLMITTSAPIYTKNGFEGVIGIDVLLKDIIKNITQYSPVEGSYSFLIDNKGNTIAFPDKAYKDILSRSAKKSEVRVNLPSNKLTSEFSNILHKMIKGEKGFASFHSGEKELFVAYAPLPQTGFSMGIVAEESVMLKATSSLHNEITNSIQSMLLLRVLPAILLILLIASIITVLLVTQIVKPVQELTEGAREIGKGNLDYKLKIKSKNEIGELATAFNQMSQALKKSREELYKYSQSLEETVKKRTRQITEANKQLKILTEQQKDQVDIMGHEVKTPLTVISQHLNLLLEMVLTKAKQAEWLKGKVETEDAKRVIEGLKKMQAAELQEEAIVTNMIEAARLDKLRFELNYSKFDIIDLIKRAIQDSEGRIEANKLKGHISFSSESQKLEIEADQTRMKQCIDGLLTNTEKYGRDLQTGELDIKVSVITQNQIVQIKVQDHGMGIAPEDMEKLGKKFSRLNSHVNGSKLSRPGGSGLGLYTYKGIIEKHHGQLFIESEGLGKGSTFTIKLPIKPLKSS